MFAYNHASGRSRFLSRGRGAVDDPEIQDLWKEAWMFEVCRRTEGSHCIRGLMQPIFTKWILSDVFSCILGPSIHLCIRSYMCMDLGHQS